jgi:replication-associated recombination protein RarA
MAKEDTSYLVLARKWRPQVFEEVVGQKHITRALQNGISQQRVAHAFLFTGARGVGKACTDAFVMSFISILILDFALTVIFKAIYSTFWPLRSLV